MAEDNKPLGEALNQPLKELSFEHIIGGPLKACVDAQQQASMATYDYMKAVGFQKDPTLLSDYQPTPVTFYFVSGGLMKRLRVPLLSILPVPYLQIGYIDLNFKAQVSGWDDESNKATFTYAPTRARVQESGSREESHSSEIRARECLDIRVRATSSDLPSGMAKLMEILDTQLTNLYDLVEEEEKKEEPKQADKKDSKDSKDSKDTKDPKNPKDDKPKKKNKSKNKGKKK